MTDLVQSQAVCNFSSLFIKYEYFKNVAYNLCAGCNSEFSGGASAILSRITSVISIDPGGAGAPPHTSADPPLHWVARNCWRKHIKFIR
jgi:hypothetical protein